MQHFGVVTTWMKKVTFGKWNHHINSWPKGFELTSMNEKTFWMKVGSCIHGIDFVIIFNGGFHLVRIICRFMNVGIYWFFLHPFVLVDVLQLQYRTPIWVEGNFLFIWFPWY
jgi:hypothetical protein